MDVAYDHMLIDSERSPTPVPSKPLDAPSAENSLTPKAEVPQQPSRPNLQLEFQETLKAFSSSPWGAKLGGLWGNVRKQGETYYEEARKEAEAAGQEAIKGISGLRETLVQRTRSLTITESEVKDSEKGENGENSETETHREGALIGTDDGVTPRDDDRSLQANETFLARFKSEAAKRLQEIQKAKLC